MCGTARATARSRSTAASGRPRRRQATRCSSRSPTGWRCSTTRVGCELSCRCRTTRASGSNDGVCDDRGRFWVGSMRIDETPHEAALYRYDGGELVTVLTGVSLSNGIGWSPDRTLMYYVDSPTQRIDVFDYDGEASNRRPFVTTTLPRGRRTASRSTTTAVSGSRCGAAPPSAATTRRAGSTRRSRSRPSGLPRAASAARTGARCSSRRPLRTVASTSASRAVSGPAASPFLSTAPSDAEPTSAR